MSIDVIIKGSEPINFANGNFASLWAMLDLPVTYEGEVTVGDLTARIMLAQTMGVQERPTITGGGNGSARWVSCGIDLDYINRRFNELLNALASRPNDEEVIWY